MIEYSFASPASKPNPKLNPLHIVIGEWKTTGSHPFLPDAVLEGQTSFRWLEGGAFVVMHSSIDHKDFPAGIAIFGSDDSADDYSMQYFDERGVSRQYTSTIKNNTWKWWRDDPEFAQRCTCEISGDGNTIIAKGEMSRKGGAWEKDLELTYTRI